MDAKIATIYHAIYMPPDLISPSYHCLENIFMVPKVFEPLKFYCIYEEKHVLRNLREATYKTVLLFHFIKRYMSFELSAQRHAKVLLFQCVNEEKNVIRNEYEATRKTECFYFILMKR